MAKTKKAKRNLAKPRKRSWQTANLKKAFSASPVVAFEIEGLCISRPRRAPQRFSLADLERAIASTRDRR